MADNEQDEQLWPAAEYYKQITRLKQAVGKMVFIAELKDTAINAGVNFSDTPLVLLDVIAYPEPDPYRRLCPHMLILNDGRGVNLGRVVRVTINQAFGPTHNDVLFQNTDFIEEVLFAPRVLSRESIAATSRGILSEMFGDEPGKLLASTPKTPQTGKKLTGSTQK